MLRLSWLVVAASACADPPCARGDDPLMGCWVSDRVRLRFDTDHTYRSWTRGDDVEETGTWESAVIDDNPHVIMKCPSCVERVEPARTVTTSARVLEDRLYWSGLFGSDLVAAGSRWSRIERYESSPGPACSSWSMWVEIALEEAGALTETWQPDCPPARPPSIWMFRWMPSATGFLKGVPDNRPYEYHLAGNMITEDRLARASSWPEAP